MCLYGQPLLFREQRPESFLFLTPATRSIPVKHIKKPRTQRFSGNMTVHRGEHRNRIVLSRYPIFIHSQRHYNRFE